jgi:hypothetical protein
VSPAKAVEDQDGGLKLKLIKLLAGFGVHLKLSPFRVRRTARVRPQVGTVTSMLSPELLQTVELVHRTPDNELFRRFQESENVHKWHHYFEIYSELFEPLRERPIRMLEIGVFRGGSLRMWKDWFHPDSTIVGIDIDPACSQYAEPNLDIFVRIGDQTDGAFLKGVADEFGPFDLILDDGGHTTTQMISSFNHLFRGALAADGTYLVEDTHTNYWPGYVDSRMTFVDFCKGLVDLIHAPYFSGHSIDAFEFTGKSEDHRLELPYIQAWLHGVRFYDSIVVLEKKTRIVPVHELR